MGVGGVVEKFRTVFYSLGKEELMPDSWPVWPWMDKGPWLFTGNWGSPKLASKPGPDIEWSMILSEVPAASPMLSLQQQREH